MSANNILVLNGDSYYSAVKFLGNWVFDHKEFLEDPNEFQFVLFTGGEDISPSLYGDTSPNGYCMYNKFRDVLEKQVYKVAFDNNIKMVGICRGLQFLTAMAGGKLMHHIENHGGCNHVMHLAEEWEGKKSIVVNSYHHQMCLPPKNSVVLGYAPKKLANGYYFGDKDELTTWTGADVEAMYLPNINAFGVQWHPEMLQTKSEGYVWFNTMVDLFLNNEGIFSNKLKYKEAGA